MITQAKKKRPAAVNGKPPQKKRTKQATVEPTDTETQAADYSETGSNKSQEPNLREVVDMMASCIDDAALERIAAFKAEDEADEDDDDYSETGSKKGRPRGMTEKSLELIAAMYEIAKDAQPITGRGIGYKLFTAGLISSMARPNMVKVYRLLKEAREQNIIPWEWIVDETRSLEKAATWDDPAEFVQTVRRSYRRDFWKQQPVRVEVWSEKGTIRGVLQPVLDEYGVGFRVMHGFSGATTIYDVAQDCDGRALIVLYVGDYDPSGLCMSESDLPGRLAKYDGDHVNIRRIALLPSQLVGLPSFPAKDKVKDSRFRWFVENYGDRCWELDAMDPNDLRACVEDAILGEIEPDAWERCRKCQEAEQESLQTVLDAWKAPRP